MKAARPLLVLSCWGLLTAVAWSEWGVGAGCSTLGLLLFVDVYVDSWIRRRA